MKKTIVISKKKKPTLTLTKKTYKPYPKIKRPKYT